MDVQVETDGPVTTVILNRPHVRNAVDGPTAEALGLAFADFEADPEARVAVFWGTGGTFCAGADLKAFANEETRNVVDGDGAGPGPLGMTRTTLSKPVIAAIAGYAVAGGLELVLWCDMRVAEEDAVFGVFCRRWGVPLIDGGTIRLPRIVGHGRAMDMILTGRPVDAREAHAMGLADRVVPLGAARLEAERLAHQIARFPQACMRADRASAIRQWDLGLEDALRQEGTRGAKVIEAEAIPGAARFAAGEGRHGAFDEG